ncbi:MAG: efflux RND transporter periplasmic adaptor subunit [Rhodobacteraceae bacterium]|nr:efflux RND transporter periplasmic adaptor subunit [Paracoccaceae bacterium]
MPTTENTPGIFRRALRRLMIVSGTVITIAIAGFAVVSGAEFLAARADQAEKPPAADAVPVSVTLLETEPGFDTQRRYVGAVEAAQATDVAFEFGGLVAELPVGEGDIVRAGDVLARLDTSLLEAERTRFEASREVVAAQLAFADLSLTRREELNARGFAPTEALDRARFDQAALVAQLAEIDAGLQSVAIRMEKSAITAPFDARIGAQLVDRGTTIGAGQALFSLLEEVPPLVRIGLPLSIDPATLETARIILGDRTYDATLFATRPDIDPVTRTRTVLFALSNASEVTFGQTATLAVTQRVDAPGTWVPVAALREGVQGVWTILVADDEDRVRPAAVEVIHAEGDRVFVRGSFPDGARLINAGPHRVTPGQLVRIIGES